MKPRVFLGVLFCVCVLVVVVLVPKHREAARFAALVPQGGALDNVEDMSDPVKIHSMIGDLRKQLASLKRPLEELRRSTKAGHEAVHAHDTTLEGNSVKSSPHHRLGYHAKHSRENTIFVMIVSYRDSDCAASINNLFTTAAMPRDIHVGVVEFNHDATVPGCVSAVHAHCNQSLFCPTDNIRVRHVADRENQGFNWALSVAQGMFRNEKYSVVVDSRTSFVKNWDRLLIDQYTQATKVANGAKCILSHAPGDVADDDARKGVPHICGVSVDENRYGIVTLTSQLKVFSSQKPANAAFASTSLLFGESVWLAMVPLDPRLGHLSSGYDYLLSARLWTNGFYFFSPSMPVVHRVRGGHGVSYDRSRDAAAATIVESVLKGKSDQFGLGQFRTLKQYEEYSGIDLEGKRVVKKLC